jgi:hypothetical protein
MRIVFDPSTLRQSKRGSVTGVVYFDFGANQQFPVAGWNDFVIVVANWWVAALQQIVEGQIGVEFRFMDGPYWITAIPQGASLLLRCIEDRPDAGEVYTAVVEVRDLERELTNFARALLDACKKAAIESADLDQLRRHLLN